jgi:hypothetical protein
MTDHEPFDEEDRLLGDVRRQVRHPFQGLGHQEKLERRRDPTRVLQHVAHEDPVRGGAEGIDPVVANPDLPGQLRVAGREGPEGIGQHAATQNGHFLDLRGSGMGRELEKPQPRPGDLHRVISHPLQVVGDLERRDDLPQVLGHGLLESQELQGELVHVELQRIHHRIPVTHALQTASRSRATSASTARPSRSSASPAISRRRACRSGPDVRGSGASIRGDSCHGCYRSPHAWASRFRGITPPPPGGG